MKAINYHRPDTMDEAVELATELGDNAAYLAGGQSLVNELKHRNTPQKEIIDIGDISELSYVETDEDIVKIGALTPHAKLAESESLQTHLPVIPKMISQVADVQVRNLGTIGGNAARADPAADYPVVLDVLDARFHTQSREGGRTIEANDFFVDYFKSELNAGELVVEIEIPLPGSETHLDFQKLATRACLGTREDGRGDFALVNAAVSMTIIDNTCEKAKIGLGAIDSTPVRATETQKSLAETAVSDINPETIGEEVSSEIDPDMHDQRVSAGYKKKLIRTLVCRGIQNCLEKTEEQ